MTNKKIIVLSLKEQDQAILATIMKESGYTDTDRQKFLRKLIHEEMKRMHPDGKYFYSKGEIHNA